MKILGISGSLRRDSWNRKLLLTAGELLPSGVELELYVGLKEVPPYDEDDDVQPAPAAVAQLRAAIAGADALLIATPEYNSSVPGQRLFVPGAKARDRRVIGRASCRERV